MSLSFKRIAARANPVFKQLRLDARDAGKAGLPAWLEGVHLCQEYRQRIGQPRLAVVDGAALDAGRADLQDLLQGLDPHTVLVFDGGLLASVSDIAGAQGVGFLVDVPGSGDVDAPITGDCVVLDRVQDPGNVGSILRTCAAAGVGCAVLTAGSAAAWSSKVLRAGQGAHFALRIVEGLSPDDVLRRVRAPLVATTLERAASLYAPDLVLPQATAWCFGHEGQGVDPSLQAAAAIRVHIPQASGVESLNVAAAAAVCLFEQRRRRLATA
ncbi:RNA methyltransferase [Achromobacter sp. GG226]|uniref:TrmH family RNA methyltransferase n=1 Tax=Verticiella alkaliphila TaxID=2779529 RepID=UPI001C0D771F|nr:RNA methyltransferase [Verticiella sp. GG226]MBU4609853.1 RNA methyltransferase [Verticiella sp. GG226]